MKKNKLLLALAILLIILLGIVFMPFEIIAPTHTPATPPPPPIIKAPILHSDWKEIVKGDTSKKQVIITINAGFGERSADGILKALAKHKIKSTFFLVGKWIEGHPEITKRIAREGHEIFNHSYDHPDYTKISPEEIKSDLQKMDDVLYKVIGIRTRPYYRAPFGYRNEKVNLAAQEAGFQHIYWSIDSIDWREGETGETIKNRVLSNLHPGAIILLHIDDIPTGDIMDELIIEIKARGYEIVSLTEGL